MAIFNKNTLSQISGFDNPIIAGELVSTQKTYWNLSVSSSDVPVSLVGATIDASIIRRQISSVNDTRYGLTFDIADYTLSVPTAIPLTITNRIDSAGTFTLVIDESTWSVISTDTQLDINAISPACFSGRIKIGFPASGVNPAQDNIIFLLFLVRSDGVVN